MHNMLPTSAAGKTFTCGEVGGNVVCGSAKVRDDEGVTSPVTFILTSLEIPRKTYFYLFLCILGVILIKY